MSNLNSQNQDNYENLLVSIEAGKDILNLLIAVCDDSDCRDRLIADYEAELTRTGYPPLSRKIGEG